MAYTAEVSRANPSAFVFLIDQSKSMEEPFGGGQGKRKATAFPTPSTACCKTLSFVVTRVRL